MSAKLPKMQIERFREDMLRHFEQRLQDLSDELLRDETPNGVDTLAKEDEHRRHRRTGSELAGRLDGKIPPKHFTRRDSVLTDLLRSVHIRTIYNIFVAVLAVLILNSIVCDLFDTGRLDLKLSLIFACFGRFSGVLSIWGCMFFASFLVFVAFRTWSHREKADMLPYENWMWLAAYIFYQFGMLYYPAKYLFMYQLPFASSLVVVCEQIRFIMKAHAFIRENVLRAFAIRAIREVGESSNIKNKGQGEDTFENGEEAVDAILKQYDCNLSTDVICPDFGNYLYFLFAPTLIYRDSYPRVANVNWDYVLGNMAQVAGSIFYCNYCVAHLLVPVFRDFNSEHVSIRTFLLGIFGCVLPGILCMLLAFFAVLHSWLNAFAEMLRFGDRMFYKDWWNSGSFSNFYRTWNVVVHDWLYSYVYRDLILRYSNRKQYAMLLVFLLSAIFHEYIVITSLKFFYPVMFMEFFGLGFVLFVIGSGGGKSRGWNVFTWMCLFLGTGLMLCLYSMEYYARVNCGPTVDGFFDYVIPRSWVCVSLDDRE